MSDSRDRDNYEYYSGLLPEAEEKLIRARQAEADAARDLEQLRSLVELFKTRVGESPDDDDDDDVGGPDPAGNGASAKVEHILFGPRQHSRTGVLREALKSILSDDGIWSTTAIAGELEARGIEFNRQSMANRLSELKQSGWADSPSRGFYRRARHLDPQVQALLQADPDPGVIPGDGQDQGPPPDGGAS